MDAFAAALSLVAAAAGPPPPKPVPTNGKVAEGSAAANSSNARCDRRYPADNESEIVICAPRQDGFRIDPSIMEARKAHRDMQAGRPKRPSEKRAISDCGIGLAPCGSGGINVIAAAATAIAMVDRLSKGQEIGSMFKTNPQPSEYELYANAKARREQAATVAEATRLAAMKRIAAKASAVADAGRNRAEY